MKKSQNPIAVRSREMLRHALLELMHEMEYDQITVTALCARAALGRKTFYRNYTDKDEVLRDYIAALTDGFLQELKQLSPFTDEAFALTMFRYWRPHAALFCLLEENGQSRFWMREFDRAAQQIGGLFSCPAELEQDMLFRRYCERYVSGGCHQILRAWMCGGARESPEEMTGVFCKIRRLGA